MANWMSVEKCAPHSPKAVRLKYVLSKILYPYPVI